MQPAPITRRHTAEGSVEDARFRPTIPKRGKAGAAVWSPTKKCTGRRHGSSRQHGKAFAQGALDPLVLFTKTVPVFLEIFFWMCAVGKDSQPKQWVAGPALGHLLGRPI